jgi:hypothetical protein
LFENLIELLILIEKVELGNKQSIDGGIISVDKLEEEMTK